MLDDGKAETCTTFFVRATFVYAIEALEESGQLLFLNSASIVFETDFAHRVVILHLGNEDIPAARVCYGIFRQVSEYGSYQRKVSLYDNLFCEVAMQCHAFLLGHYGELICYFINDIVDYHGFLGNEHASALHACDDRL